MADVPSKHELTPEDEARMQLATSPVVRGLLVVVGSISVALGVAGIFLPLLPTTPFLLLAAACYARASPRFYGWLLSNRTFGPIIRAWRDKRAMPRRAKGKAIVLVAITFGASIAIVDVTPLRVMLACLGAGLLVFLGRMPVVD